MCFFKKKKDTKNTTRVEIKVDTDLITTNAMSFDALLVLSKDNEELSARLAALQDKVKYLNPSVNDKVIKLDEKIGNAIGDLKIALNKSSEKTDKIDKLINDIELIIVERNTANI